MFSKISIFLVMVTYAIGIPLEHEHHQEIGHHIPIQVAHAAPIVTHAAPIVTHAAPIVAHAPIAVAHAAPAHHEEVYPDHHPKYEFKYGVQDHHTGDHKSQSEVRDGDVVKGEYSLVQPDGIIRNVHYSADHHNGFNAEVTYSGHAAHPEEVKKVAVAVPAPVAVPTHYHH